MKYAILFLLAAVLLFASAILRGGWYLLLLWPALSFAVVGSGYLGLGPQVFGKSNKGTLAAGNFFLILPYLLLMWSAWYLLRLVKRERAYDQVTERITIGRRLLEHEFPTGIDHVIDLTCEFPEPKSMRSVDYHSFQILDGFIPSAKQMQAWLEIASGLTGTIYIHCAEGHGRTGLFTAALLVKLGEWESADEALRLIQSKRPLVRLGSKQTEFLELLS